MTIVTRQSSPKSGAKAPADSAIATRSSSSSRRKMKIKSVVIKPSASRRGTLELDKPGNISNDNIAQCSSSTGSNSLGIKRSGTAVDDEVATKVFKTVMCETTNLTPANKSAAAVLIDDNANVVGDISGEGSEGGSTCMENLNQIAVGVKRISKTKLKLGTQIKDDSATACRKSKRLLNKNANIGWASPAPHFMGRTVELVNPPRIHEPHNFAQKIMFLSGLDLIPKFCFAPPNDPVGTLKSICVKAILRERIKDYKMNEERRNMKLGSEPEEVEEETLKEDADAARGSVPLFCCSIHASLSTDRESSEEEKEKSFNSFETHVKTLLSSETKSPEGVKTGERSVADCLRLMQRIGTDFDIIGPPAASASLVSPAEKEIQEVVDSYKAEKVAQAQAKVENIQEEEIWLNWNDHMKILFKNLESRLEAE